MTLNNQPVFVIEDFTALGQISLVAALTILQAFDLETAAVPTEILSTHTEGYGKPVIMPTQQWVPNCLNHWHSIKDLRFNGGLIGYIGDAELIRVLVDFLQEQKTKINGPIIVDPAMADDGKLYPGLIESYPEVITKLCQQATIITPNWTELCLLAEQDPTLTANQDNFARLCSILRHKEIKAQVVVTGVHQADHELIFMHDGQEDSQLEKEHLNGHYYGAGDVFTALLLAYLSQSQSLTEAVKSANDKIQIAIQETQPLNLADRRYGLKLGKLLRSI